MSLLVSQSQQIQTSAQIEQKEFITEAENAQEQIREYYNSLISYSAPSMKNICNLLNLGYETEGSNYYQEHSKYCDIYGNAALAFGNVLKNAESNTVDDIKNALSNVKNATQKAIVGLKSLIIKENATIENVT